MFFIIQPHEQKVFQVISETAKELGYPTYVVGGYVRDRLIGRPSKDMDIVCVGSGIRLAQAISAKLRPIPQIAVFKRFGTAMLKHEDLEIEFVGARKESYRVDSRKPTVEDGTLEDDQNRRDFTINALAVSLNDNDFGSIVDPFNGLEDLENKIIRTPLEPGKTFSDDPLRIMRGIRFAAQLDFHIEESTLNAIGKYRNRLNIVSQERVAVELNKILLSPKPSKGFHLMNKTGVLENVLPDLGKLKGVEVKNGIGHKDNFYHTLKVVDNLSAKSKNLWLRWAALLHDIGKAPTKRFNKELGWTFHGHDAVGASMVPRIFKKLRLPLDAKMKYVQKIVALHQRPMKLTTEEISDSAIRRILFDAGEDIDDLMQLCEADITSKNESKIKRYLKNYENLRARMKELEESDSLRNWQPPITGEMIMETFGIEPSRAVGDIKNFIRESILEGEIQNDFNSAKALMIKKGTEMGLKVVRKAN